MTNPIPYHLVAEHNPIPYQIVATDYDAENDVLAITLRREGKPA